MIAMLWETVAAIMLKLIYSTVLGAAIGLEREIHGRPAGMRTHMLIALGVTLICEVSKAFAPNDQARIASQIVTGIGFLGAGSILKLGVEIKGITTAASIWATSAVAMAVSVGGAMGWVALGAVLLTLFTLAVMDNIERRLAPSAHPISYEIEMEGEADMVKVIDTLAQTRAELKSIVIASRMPLILVADIWGSPQKVLDALVPCAGVRRVTRRD